MISIFSVVANSKMANSLADMSNPYYIQSRSNEIYILYSIGIMGLLMLIGSLFCFFKISQAPNENKSTLRKKFVTGVILFIVGLFLLMFFSYVSGQNNMPFITNPGFDPRTT